MSIESIDWQFILESDISPLIVFDHKGHILWLNEAAEILLGYTDHKELFKLALTHAPKDFGHQTILRELHYRQLNFYAFQVAYNSEEWIALRLYYRPKAHEERHIDPDRLLPTNLNLLLEAAIGIFRMEYDRPLSLLVDQELPESRIDQNGFSKLLRKVLESFRESERIDGSFKMTLGEFIRIDAKRYPVLRLILRGDHRLIEGDPDIERLADSLQISAFLEPDSVTLDIPFIR
ncbi:PAS domain-containing protein [Nitratifractor salsuginis]|uniref:PAS fold domain protein n=1 Tax=Nitratifractor salsuginis (strain DSM 16511 / JCM 12458 / E9I37-1) TaxID=749222 RepID=E6WYX5_NITSE|nr:PAS domain-containing protein [Nitratifractor salsuginis]ADV46561.1 PAS fold domain protein [Nitratifractor salsuginis DSM 16511]